MRWAGLLLLGGLGAACLISALSAMGQRLDTEQALAQAELAKAEAALLQMQALMKQIEMNLAFQNALLEQIKLTNFLTVVIVVWAVVLVTILALIIILLVRRQNRLEDLLWKQLGVQDARSGNYLETSECLQVGSQHLLENQYALPARKRTERR